MPVVENLPLPDEAARNWKALVCAQVARLGYGVQDYRHNEANGHEEVLLADGKWHQVADLLANAGGKP